MEQDEGTERLHEAFRDGADSGMVGIAFDNTGGQGINGEELNSTDALRQHASRQHWHVPGLYHLVEIYKERTANGLGEKFMVVPEDFGQICNEIAKDSEPSFTKIYYAKLDGFPVKTIGVYGSRAMIAKLLFQIGAVEEQM
ncbi:hypothetical protein BJ742DRAFT_544630 [Cladochytrium replicatum]|nr:hypothetical protein BJ742DRAFT_544630 [Cladochytrium replicatum]